MELNIELGEIVSSTAGRDEGRYFVVIDIVNQNYVKIADGDLRKIENPKLKNIKHLNTTGEIVEELSIWLHNKKRVRDEDLKKVVRDYEQNKEA